MKKVTFAILTVGVALFASCGGNNAEAEKAKADSLAAVATADSLAAAAAAQATADSLAAAAATPADTSKTPAAPAAAPAPAAH